MTTPMLNNPHIVTGDGRALRSGQGEKLLLTPEEAAEALSVGRTKLYELLATGILRSVRIDRSRRVPMSALVELVERLQRDEPILPMAERTEMAQLPASGHVDARAAR